MFEFLNKIKKIKKKAQKIQKKAKKNGKIDVFKLRNGDNRTVRSWYQKYYPYFFSIALKKVSKKKDAEEIVQETFINCLKNIQSYQENSSLKTWMYSVFRHEVADFFRKKYAKRQIETIPLADKFLNIKHADAEETSNLIIHQLQNANLHRVKTVLANMLDKKVELLKMKYIDGLQVKEIAQKLDRSFKSVESELFRARQRFKKLYLLAEEGEL